MRKLSALLALVSLIAVAAPVWADEAGDVSALLRQGQVDAAASRLEAALASKPRDAQLRCEDEVRERGQGDQ